MVADADVRTSDLKKNAQPATRRRRPQERAEATKSKLLEAAIGEFADRGFDAVTIRDIEVKADVQRGLLSYHFGDKESLWKESVNALFLGYREFQQARDDIDKDLPTSEVLSFRIRNYVRFSATHPELNRLMIQEGNRDSWRLRYILETFVRGSRPSLRDLVQSDLGLTEEEFVHWNYMFLGASLVFSLGAEAEELFGVNVFDDDFVTRHAQFVSSLLTCRRKSAEDKDSD